MLSSSSRLPANVSALWVWGKLDDYTQVWMTKNRERNESTWFSPAYCKKCYLGFTVFLGSRVFFFLELHWIDTVLSGHSTPARWALFHPRSIHYADCLALSELLFLSVYNLCTVHQSTCARLELNGVVSVSHAAAPPTSPQQKAPPTSYTPLGDCPETPPSLPELLSALIHC